MWRHILGNVYTLHRYSAAIYGKVWRHTEFLGVYEKENCRGSKFQICYSHPRGPMNRWGFYLPRENKLVNNLRNHSSKFPRLSKNALTCVDISVMLVIQDSVNYVTSSHSLMTKAKKNDGLKVMVRFLKNPASSWCCISFMERSIHLFINCIWRHIVMKMAAE